jgi:N4-(beta-N-acetylglucosaminyl)-L-asparaginase
MPDQFPMQAIASSNGLEATKRAYELMLAGADTLDAAVAGVTLVEDDPRDMTVGLGGLPNENGVVELDAAVMHGPTHQAGAVASLRNIRNAAQVARLVMQQTDHVLLVGEGALAFAKAHGFPEENLLTETARKIWLYWKQTNSDRDDWLPPPVEQLDPEVRKFFKLEAEGPASPPGGEQQLPLSEADRPTGTVHCACLNGRGDISCTTTTSGLAFKIPGRVGDSPIVGAGLYVDNEIGSCGSTGRGEANLSNLCCFAAVELMRNGATPQEAGIEIINRVVRHTSQPHLLDEAGRPNFGLKFYLLNKQGHRAGVSLYGPTQFAATDADGTRLEDCWFLHRRNG